MMKHKASALLLVLLFQKWLGLIACIGWLVCRLQAGEYTAPTSVSDPDVSLEMGCRDAMEQPENTAWDSDRTTAIDKSEIMNSWNHLETGPTPLIASDNKNYTTGLYLDYFSSGLYGSFNNIYDGAFATFMGITVRKRYRPKTGGTSSEIGGRFFRVKGGDESDVYDGLGGGVTGGLYLGRLLVLGVDLEGELGLIAGEYENDTFTAHVYTRCFLNVGVDILSTVGLSVGMGLMASTPWEISFLGEAIECKIWLRF